MGRRRLITDSFQVVKKRKRGNKKVQEGQSPPLDKVIVQAECLPQDAAQPEELELLKQFDLSWKYGPCTACGMNTPSEKSNWWYLRLRRSPCCFGSLNNSFIPTADAAWWWEVRALEGGQGSQRVPSHGSGLSLPAASLGLLPGGASATWIKEERRLRERAPRRPRPSGCRFAVLKHKPS
ncbi:DNA polymerase delta subunit 4 isoform X1 [Varanus komodoensis]|uniref:DNA polymerase delta subunit 4 isoform X1 n=1 Tax=Varanus komodoensis TaxID=61221 RepID=UPI001CF7A9B9|nr:DNA polymerase delta subunit 4 isoform X1 [Varanus komodoensis]XP_044294104.1 DNA polymerase delta subunit 4 isoform X1 [Varanus komodoensis]